MSKSKGSVEKILACARKKKSNEEGKEVDLQGTMKMHSKRVLVNLLWKKKRELRKGKKPVDSNRSRKIKR